MARYCAISISLTLKLCAASRDPAIRSRFFTVPSTPVSVCPQRALSMKTLHCCVGAWVAGICEVKTLSGDHKEFCRSEFLSLQPYRIRLVAVGHGQEWLCYGVVAVPCWIFSHSGNDCRSPHVGPTLRSTRFSIGASGNTSRKAQTISC
jgi:hypothetical protein